MSGFERLDRLSLPWRTRLRARGPAEWQLPARCPNQDVRLGKYRGEDNGPERTSSYFPRA